MAEIKKYTIGKNRLKKSFMHGFTFLDTGTIFFEKEEHHILFLTKLNSMEKDSEWGRLHLNLISEEPCISIIRAYAANDSTLATGQELDSFFTTEEILMADKKEWMERAGCITVMNRQDILLYELTGQYLWISIEVTGGSRGRIENLYLVNPGDNFMQTFPDIYQDNGSFFHRYLSIFSTLYNELSDTIAQKERWLNLDTAPEAFLYQYAQWLGLDVQGEFLEITVLRKLLGQAYYLNRRKGTKEALLRIIRIVMGEEAVIVERNLLEEFITEEEKKLYNTLYGNSIQDITILISGKADEQLQLQLEFLLKQFKPMRSKIKLVCYSECNQMDSYCYLDKNAKLSNMPKGSLDTGKELNASSMQS